ncbi:MAG: hypothetical protein J6N45_07555 [Alphaproteobacteria bacterium]|nr:hypothetical protein [Alphaproteobacteria bacterium]
MRIVNAKSEKVWVVFMPHNIKDGKTCWERVFCWVLSKLHKNFSHVVVFKRSIYPGNVIAVNTCSNNISIEELSLKQLFGILTNTNNTAVVADIQIAPIKAKGLLTCVSVAKSILGVTKASIITPYQLYKYLKGKENGRKESQTKHADR